MSFDAVMVDLETFGTGPNSAIASIGAFKFGLDSVQTVEEISPEQLFYVNVDLKSCVKAGLELDPTTVMWWLSQEKEAQGKLLSPDPIYLSDALKLFSEWFGRDGRTLWGNGATFDNVILRNAYDKLKLGTPWHYTRDRCYRTFKNLKMEAKVPFIRYGLHHNAVDDSISQGLHLQRIIKAIQLS